jgi:hypothetical protein
MTRRVRASSVAAPSRMRCRGCGSFPVACCQTPKSKPLYRTPWFQGFAPLMSPLRPDAVSSIDSLAPSMGFVPLQGRSTLAVGCDVQRASQPPANGLLVGTEIRSPGRVPVALSRASLGWLLCGGVRLAPSSAASCRSLASPVRLFSGSRESDTRLDVLATEVTTFVAASSFRVCPSIEVVKRGSQDALAPCASPRGGVGGGSPVGQPH